MKEVTAEKPGGRRDSPCGVEWRERGNRIDFRKYANFYKLSEPKIYPPLLTQKNNITITLCSPIGVSSNLWTTLPPSKLFQYSFPFLSFPSACKICDFYIVSEQKESCDIHVTNSMADWNYI